MREPIVLLTGSAGHAGRGVAEILRRRSRVRGLDVKPSDACDESSIGSVTDLSLCRMRWKA